MKGEGRRFRPSCPASSWTANREDDGVVSRCTGTRASWLALTGAASLFMCFLGPRPILLQRQRVERSGKEADWRVV